MLYHSQYGRFMTAYNKIKLQKAMYINNKTRKKGQVHVTLEWSQLAYELELVKCTSGHSTELLV